jgi:hypothetical protein
MIRAEKNVVEYFFEALRKSTKKNSRIGMGITVLNSHMLSKGWRPALPESFTSNYPKLTGLVNQCWLNDPALRPDFTDVLRRMNGEISDEIRANKEPTIAQLRDEPDELYWAADTLRVKEYVPRGKGGGKGGYGRHLPPTTSERQRSDESSSHFYSRAAREGSGASTRLAVSLRDRV